MKKLYRCRFCGHEIICENLSEDFVCPICGHPAKDFDFIKNVD